MKAYGQLGSFGVLVVVGVAAAEVLIMISPFASFFYTTIHFGSLLGFLSKNPLTAWLDGFFLNHSVVTESTLLEWQRKVGRYLFTLGIWGFILSAFQVYINKISKRDIVRGLLYRYVKHPQYLCLAIAGWGLLTIWPRFLLLGAWVTMLFLYAGLSRFEEQRMEVRFGADYSTFTGMRGAFLPGSPIRRLFEATFGKVRPCFLGWLAAYVSCLVLIFSLGFILRTYTKASTAILFKQEHNTVIISAWPQPEKWIEETYQVAINDKQVQQQLKKTLENKHLVVTILPPKYVMKEMYYKKSSNAAKRLTMAGFSFVRLCRLAGYFLLPWLIPNHFMGVEPDITNELVQLGIFMR